MTRSYRLAPSRPWSASAIFSVLPRRHAVGGALMLAVLSVKPLAAQVVAPHPARVPVRVSVCHGQGGHLDGGMRRGVLLRVDSAGVALEDQQIIPIDRVMSAEMRTSPSNQQRGSGTLAGMFVGGLLALASMDKNAPPAAAVLIPVGALLGSVVGYFVGALVGEPARWAPVPLPAHGAACAPAGNA